MSHSVMFSLDSRHQGGGLLMVMGKKLWDGEPEKRILAEYL